MAHLFVLTYERCVDCWPLLPLAHQRCNYPPNHAHHHLRDACQQRKEDATQGEIIGTTGATGVEIEDPPIRLDVGFGLDPPELATTSSNFAYISVVLTFGKSLRQWNITSKSVSL
ncbi:hypothetical protein PIB30_041806 [Stylosanthes scabra]|uniref:Uncharacterized protein n=1 Tax=Stylosanthes scabra TaxID=79078 RepID=A0ABU6YDE9_9FABA|nr:hypothetical protein [Stylosanthes scabra]